MTTLIHLTILILATFRLTRMLYAESLPFQVGTRVRWWLQNGRLKDTWIVDLFACPYCLSVWVAMMVLALDLHPAGRVVNNVLALSAAVMFVWDMFGIFTSANTKTES